ASVWLPTVFLILMRRIGLALGCILFAVSASAQVPAEGRKTFEACCWRCHGADGGGTEMGPAILQKLKARSDTQLSALIRDGIPLRGLPPNRMADDESAALIWFLRTIQRDPSPGAAPRTFRTAGGTIEG